MNIMIFDTETTSLEKPFIYNIGYVIYDTEKEDIILTRDYVVEQIWHNLPLFSTSYYADKRPLYIDAMRSHKTIMDKFGYITQQMIRDIKQYKIEYAYAYNSPFDDKAFEYNCDWFKCINPFDTISVLDIRAMFLHSVDLEHYKDYCEEKNYLTESGNYSSTAEIVYRFISWKEDFIEDHTALSDSLIELEILQFSISQGGKIGISYHCPKSITRETTKSLTIYKNNEIVYETEYEKMRMNKEKTEIKLK